MKRHSWTPSLHPRGKGGKFSRKGGPSASELAGRAPANKQQRFNRKLGYAGTTYGAVMGTAIGTTAVVVGAKTGNHKLTAAGVARIGVAGATASQGFKGVRRETSKDFHSLTKAQRRAESKKNARRNLPLGLAGVGLDFGIGAGLTKSLAAHQERARLGLNTTPSTAQKAAKRAAQKSAKVATRTAKGPSLAKATRKMRYSTPKARSASMDAGIKKMHVGARASENLYSPADPFTAIQLRRDSVGRAVRSSSTRTGVSSKSAPRTGRLGDRAGVKAAQKLGRKAKPRRFKK